MEVSVVDGGYVLPDGLLYGVAQPVEPEIADLFKVGRGRGVVGAIREGVELVLQFDTQGRWRRGLRNVVALVVIRRRRNLRYTYDGVEDKTSQKMCSLIHGITLHELTCKALTIKENGRGEFAALKTGQQAPFVTPVGLWQSGGAHLDGGYTSTPWT
jgi:hypothetical protein